MKNDTRYIEIVGAREHNLKNVTVKIPKNTLTVITGPSGSGKSSLALDTLYTEGKRRYTESLSAYARQFLGVSQKPVFDSITGLCPAIAIEQKTVGANPRSTVGTITEIYDYLRVLFARIGTVHCPGCMAPITGHNPESITEMLLENFKNMTIVVSAPIARQEKGEFKKELHHLFKEGYYRFLIDGKMHKIEDQKAIEELKIAKTYKHDIAVIIDVITVGQDESSRLQEGIEKAAKIASNIIKISCDDKDYFYSFERMCLQCALSFEEVEPRLFSFNSPLGACQTCSGLGIVHQWPWSAGDQQAWKEKYPDFFSKYAKQMTCTACHGKRLNSLALSVLVGKKSIADLCEIAIDQLFIFFEHLVVEKNKQVVAEPLFHEIKQRLSFLNQVGLSYLTLGRAARTLSGGEGQRIRLATQIGSALAGVLYVLDEPSIGLHQRDNDRLIKTLQHLRDQDNTVIVVEHDLDTMRAADYIIDMGPAAGIHGGQVTAVGTPAELAKNKKSLTGGYLSGRSFIPVPKVVRQPASFLELSQITMNNVKDLTIKIPMKVLCCVSGVSGSGKSTVIMQSLVPTLEKYLKTRHQGIENSFLSGAEGIEDLVVIDQTPIGRSSRSNPATYLGIFDDIRSFFAQLPESKIRGYEVGRFSFNRPGGRCAECSGDGTITVSMHFLADVTMVCKMCKGKRYNKETLSITYKNKNIADILEMTALEALEFFIHHNQPLTKRLQLLCDVGLDYITLGQCSTTLSGGEAQRIKLVNELAKRGKDTLYVLDEPTTGLHSEDIQKLLIVLNRLVSKGNSMIVIEHNIDVLKTADYIIDMGPEGGNGGGTIVAEGTPRQVAHSKISFTAAYLRPFFE